MTATINQTRIVVGTRVRCALHYCGEGIVVGIHGDQRPETVRTFLGGAGVSGGRATFDVVYLNGSRSERVPEAIVRGIQWTVLDEVADADEIARAVAFAAEAKARKEAEKAAEDAAHAAELARLRAAPEFAHLAQGDDRYGGKLAAANIRTDLKRAFPGVRFSVRTPHHGSVYVRWTGGPTAAAVSERIGRYQGGRFNGMEDCYEHGRSAWCEVFGGADYVSTTRVHEPQT